MNIGCRNYPAEVSFRLPPSKSILARIVLLRLVEQVACGRVFSYDGLDTEDPSDDVEVMLRFADYFNTHIYPLSGSQEIFAFDCGESGTALRLITTFCSAVPIHIRLTARGHLNDRPMEELLLVLEEWGASFDFEEDRKYFAPFIIHGATLTPSDVTSTENWRSSQFVSALILTSPLVTSDFSIHRSLKSPSSEYISLTISVMRSFGYDVEWKSNKIQIPHLTDKCDLDSAILESDWSSASYWYQLLLLHPEIDVVHLPGLKMDSAQPDAVCADVFDCLGIRTVATPEGVLLRRSASNVTRLDFDCSQSPDLFPALFSALVGAGVSFTLSGIELLRYKESDRLSAMLEGAEALGYSGFILSDDSVAWDACPRLMPSHAQIKGYSDHRVVMAFSVLATALSGTSIHITDHSAVAKSYPTFYAELGQES